MATTLSIQPNSLAALATAADATDNSSARSAFPKTSQLFMTARRKKRHYLIPKASCSNSGDKAPSINTPLQFDRREMLVGLGGLYGLTGLGTQSLSASASPILPPDFSQCGTLELPANVKSVNCCPPKSATVVDFKLPGSNAPLRIRPAAHLTDKAYIAKYKKALELMKALPDSDPRSFTQQSNVHCAYCNGGYTQVGFPNLDLQVHGSWLFLPFHRYYLYFFERILGSLINDQTFGIPYWNWDAPAGMQIPAMFTESNSVLSKALRDARHKPPRLVDLDYSGTDEKVSDQEQISSNLSIMYRQMLSNGKTAKLFHGGEYRAGGDPGGPGSLESYPHGP
uniref:Tyrosinase copper-binding domain-containing protein n=1 Tax=Kalanchoe fedtschenkoi TaxID=63787 RepID=A0A7N0REJ2_KALFE